MDQQSQQDQPRQQQQQQPQPQNPPTDLTSSASSRENVASTSTAASSPYMPMFELFRAELDAHHDRRERVIKASRDITAGAKKIIFALQRVRTLAHPLPAAIAKSNAPYYDDIRKKFAAVSRDLQGLNAYRYARQISGGCQEYMEAASFERYLQHADLLAFPDAAAQVRALDGDGPGVALSEEDYLLGIYDMTGELMRFAITTMATSGALPVIRPPANPSPASDRNLLTDMRALRAALDALDARSGPFAAEADKKADVMRNSVEKVEKALYGLVVRGAERPPGWNPALDAGARVEALEG